MTDTSQQLQKDMPHNMPRLGMVHFILSHSYVIFLIAVVLGALVHVFSPIRIFSGMGYPYLGFGMIIIGSLLIYWAQSTSSNTQKEMQKGKERDFMAGPYAYSRNPTHIGLTIMTLGLACILNSLSMVVFIIIASIVAKFIFLRQEEAVLETRYGQPYRDYKKKVSTWV
jgi:protein-S-isoprenylcysteine O-methyltransferase Ste14